MTKTKQGKKRHVSGNHVKMKIPEYVIELCEGKYPLHYWKERKIIFLFLQNFQRYTFMVAPATVEPVERLFSIAG